MLNFPILNSILISIKNIGEKLKLVSTRYARYHDIVTTIIKGTGTRGKHVPFECINSYLKRVTAL